MPDLNPLKEGDVSSVQYTTVITQPISANLAITKGVVYTKNAAGHLIAVTDTVVKGIFQAATSAPANATAGDGKVQCLTQRSRFLKKAIVAGLVTGDSVTIASGGASVISGAKSAANYVGTVFEIYTKDANGTAKDVSVANDLVIIDMAGV